MATGTIEDRLLTLEQDVAQLKQRVQHGDANWLRRILGSMQNEPDFEVVLQLGRDIRNKDRPTE